MKPTFTELAAELDRTIAEHDRIEKAEAATEQPNNLDRAKDDAYERIGELKAALSRLPVTSASDAMVAIALASSTLNVIATSIIDEREQAGLERQAQRLLYAAVDFIGESGADMPPNVRGYFFSGNTDPRKLQNAA